MSDPEVFASEQTRSAVLRAQYRYHRAVMVMVGASMAALGALLVLVLVGQAEAHGRERKAEASRTVLSAQSKLLVECTTPPEARVPPAAEVGPDDCYARSRAGSAQVVASIGDISVAAAACGAANPGDVPATRKCVDLALKR